MTGAETTLPLSLDIHHRQGGFALEAAIEARPGVLALFGASGSGKTTLIDIVAGLTRPLRARIELDGHVLTDTAAGIAVPPHHRRIGYVFQEGRLFPHLDVRQNLAYGRWFARDRIDRGSDAARLAQVAASSAKPPWRWWMSRKSGKAGSAPVTPWTRRR